MPQAADPPPPRAPQNFSGLPPSCPQLGVHHLTLGGPATHHGGGGAAATDRYLPPSPIPYRCAARPRRRGDTTWSANSCSFALKKAAFRGTDTGGRRPRVATQVGESGARGAGARAVDEPRGWWLGGGGGDRRPAPPSPLGGALGRRLRTPDGSRIRWVARGLSRAVSHAMPRGSSSGRRLRPSWPCCAPCVAAPPPRPSWSWRSSPRCCTPPEPTSLLLASGGGRRKPPRACAVANSGGSWPVRLVSTAGQVSSRGVMGGGARRPGEGTAWQG
jgi:hypothetical protein